MNTNLAKPQNVERKLDINCLTHLLNLWSNGHRFIILENNDHFIGANDKKIFELGDTFKKDLQLGYSLNGGNSYLPLVFGDEKRLKKIFNLDKKYSKIIDEYMKYYLHN